MAQLIIIMGVSGTGKSTIGELLSEKLQLPYHDADDFHPTENIKKMQSGQPLDDEDRQEWLLVLNKLLQSQSELGAVLACSALKDDYRKILRKGAAKNLRFIYLKGSFEQILKRIQNRKGHFMPADLLQSQFEALQPPKVAITVTINESPESMLKTILTKIGELDKPTSKPF